LYEVLAFSNTQEMSMSESLHFAGSAANFIFRRQLEGELVMKSKWMLLGLVFVLSLAFAVPAFAGGRGDGPVIYVTGQDLFYDSIVTADPLPAKGPFQKLEMAGPSGLQTEFGPGDPGYVGGRWWLDLNGNDEMDAGDLYFSCPLLGPGRATQMP
jgi:hypothetical protein